MTARRQAWNAWDTPYFGGAEPGERSKAARPAAEAGPVTILALAGDGSRAGRRLWAVLFGVRAALGGAAITGLLLFASLVLSFGSAPGASEVLVASLIGGTVAICGVAVAVLAYRHAGRPAHVKIDGDRLEVAYETFKVPLVLARTSVRAVTTDDTPPLLFTNNKRFPIAGAIPPHAFADALDNLPAAPWEDFDPDRRGRVSSPVVIDENMGSSRRQPDGYTHDDPARDGWASAGSDRHSFGSPREAYLWSADGSSLPFLRVGPGDVPNLAILFHGPVRTPRVPWWFELSPINANRLLFRGGRLARGLLVRVRDAEAAASVFDRWGVVRRITADDVVEEGLLVAKPLTGMRAAAYGVVVVGALLVDLLVRLLR